MSSIRFVNKNARKCVLCKHFNGVIGSTTIQPQNSGTHFLLIINGKRCVLKKYRKCLLRVPAHTLSPEFKNLTEKVIKMAGMKCPKCGKFTFFETSTGRKCSSCGHTMFVPPNGGMGGKGKLCLNCYKNTVFNGRCTNCGAIYK